MWTNVSEKLTASIMMVTVEAVTSEMSVNIYQATCCNIPEDSHIKTELFQKFKCAVGNPSFQ
jgi:hypothetical protein